ncbi:MAG: IS66 family transposase [Thermoplasmata archaeon]
MYKKLRMYENPHTPPSKKRYPPKNDESETDKDENEDGDTEPDQPELTTDDRPTTKKPGRKEGHEGTTRPKPESDIILDVTECECPYCSSSLDEPERIETRTIEDISDKCSIEVTEFRIGYYSCDCCGEDVIANHPDCPDEGRFGNRVCVQTTLLKFEDRLPHRKVKNALERDYGLKVSIATVLDLTRRTADKLRSAYEKVLKMIRESDVLYVDETGMKVDGKQYWAWVFRNKDSILIVLRDSRGKGVLQEVLGDRFDGVMVCDGWRSYPSFTSNLQRCWSHLLREAKDLDSVEGKNLAEELQEMYNELTDFVDREPPPHERKKKKEEATTAMNEMIEQEWDKEETAKLVTKIERGMDHWFTFVTEENVEPTNNKAERALREHVVIRKIIGTLRNEKGTYIHETVMSMLATWKERDRNPYDEMMKILRS